MALRPRLAAGLPFSRMTRPGTPKPVSTWNLDHVRTAGKSGTLLSVGKLNGTASPLDNLPNVVHALIVYITLPFRSDDVPGGLEPACEEAMAVAEAPTRTRRIVLVEDNPDSRDTLRMLLEIWGHTVEVAADGLQGVEKVLGWRPDVAIIDIGLPQIDGLEVARRIRGELHDGVRLIALTAYAQPDDQRRALAAGFEHFMAKPADCERLARLITA